MNKKWFWFGTGALALISTGVFAKQRLDDLESNIAVYPTNIRVHGIVNGYFLRLVATIRVVNNSNTTVPISNINMDVLAKTGEGQFSSIAFIPQVIPSITLQSGKTTEEQIDIDVNLLTASGPLLQLFKGSALTLRLNSKLYVAGVFRVEIPVDTQLAVPAAIRNTVSALFGTSGLGLTAYTGRKLKPGTEYDQYFKTPEKTDPMLSKGMETIPTVETIAKLSEEYKSQSAAIARVLKGKTTQETLQNVWNFCYDHIGYEEDKAGVEQLRTPNRVWADRKADCDCYTLFISSILRNLGIEHKYRVVKLKNKSYYQHIYVVVPKTSSSMLGPKQGISTGNRTDYWVLDPVLDGFDQEPENITYKYDHMIPVQLLNGLGNPDLPTPKMVSGSTPIQQVAYGQEFKELGSTVGGLGCPKDRDLPTHNALLCKEFSDRVKLHLQNTVKYMKELKSKGVQIDIHFIEAVDRVLSVWDNPEQRLATAVNIYKSPVSSLSTKTFFEALAFQAAMDAKGLEGLAGFKEWWRENIGKPINRAFQKLEASFQKAWEGLKNVAQNIAKHLKRLGELLLRWNPATALLRIGTLALIAMNFKNRPGDAKLYYNHRTWEEAKAKGYLWENWNKSKNVYEALRNTAVVKFQASEYEFKSALIDRKLKVDEIGKNKREFDDLESMMKPAEWAAPSSNILPDGKPIFVGQLLKNYYGETDEMRNSQTSIVVTDTLGENGYVVLVSGVPSFEAVALKVHVNGDDPSSPGHAYALTASGEYWETIDGNWYRSQNPNQVIPPFAKFTSRFFTVDAQGNRTYDVVPESKWADLHIMIFKKAKADAAGSGSAIFQVPTEVSQNNSGAGAGVALPTTGNSAVPGNGANVLVPGGNINLTSFNGLGIVSESLIALGSSAALLVLQWALNKADQKAIDKEPTDGGTIPGPPEGTVFDPETGLWYNPTTGEYFNANGNPTNPNDGGGDGSGGGTSTALLIGGGVLAAIALASNLPTGKKSLKGIEEDLGKIDKAVKQSENRKKRSTPRKKQAARSRAASSKTVKVNF